MPNFCRKGNIMSVQKDFTDAVVREECTRHHINSGYQVNNGNYYDSYMENKAWENYLAAMNPVHKQRYMEGDGGELKEKGKQPPKMASLISSSRMIYLLSKDIPYSGSTEFYFEQKRDTVVGHDANLDGFYYNGDKYFYVEAKCREPYGHSLVQHISSNYSDVYCMLREKMRSVFNCVMEDLKDGYMNVIFLSRGKPVKYFDIKQMICHLLGIAAYHLRAEEDPKPITFLYLLYDPRKLVFPEKTSAEILRIYEKTCQAALGYRFEEMFGYIIDYLVDVKNLPGKHRETLKRVFTFELCSQYDYHSKF